ncbi:major capsid protein [Brevibacillus composti]|uniref:Major capsid protein n=1 Tax=Brevibacillus composti TaxID=2796470 RepID=A0A7T5EN71_9BACL|nr:major capsid protein [Brevibacillus composti]QQE75714.1 major capsid protein [Brevibacillus composti]QUO42740.1 major capsid protein [Brevibacillus composti]
MNTINIYDTRTMMQAIEQMKPARTFFRDTFFPTVETFVTEKVDVETKKGKRVMAPFVSRNRGGIIVGRQGFRTDTYETPYIAPQRVLTKNDINKRMMGENIYSTRTPEQRALELLAKDITDLSNMITRTEEWFCREILINGRVTIKGWVDKVGGTDFVEDEIDYEFTNKETLSGTTAWDQSTSKKYDDLKRIRQEIIQNSGVNPNIVIMASNVADLFINDAAVQKLLDIRNLTIGTIQPSVQMDGLTYIGTLTSLGLELYTYDEWFLDENGVEQPMMPADHLIMGRRGLGSRLYGAVTQVEQSDGEFHTYEGTRIPKVWTDVNNDQKMIRLASRPLPKPEDVDSWFVLKVK